MGFFSSGEYKMWRPKATKDIDDWISSTLKTVKLKMEHESVSAAIGDQYKKWHYKNPVLIEAPTGSGKTTFVYEVLIREAVKQWNHILLISNRIVLSLQQKMIYTIH